MHSKHYKLVLYYELRQAKADIGNRDKIFISEREVWGEEYDTSYRVEDKRQPLKSKLGIIER